MIGLYGGTFDPVHFGHLRTALEIVQRLGLESVRLIPCHQPPHRPEPAVTAQQRLAMLQLAVEGVPELLIDPRELQRDGPSYMVDTLQTIRDEVGANVSIGLIIGMDAFAKLPSWHRWHQLFELAHIIVMQRPDEPVYQEQTLRTYIQPRVAGQVAELKRMPAGRVLFQDVIQLAISASQIRHLIHSGITPRFLLPEKVLKLIEQQGYYRDNEHR